MRSFNFFILVFTIIALTACSTPSRQSIEPTPSPNVEKEQTVETALQLRDDGKIGDAAKAMLNVSEHATSDERPRYLFEAAQLYLSVQDVSYAEDVLQKLRDAFPGNGYTTVLNAQISLVKGDIAGALASIGSEPPQDVDAVTKGIYWLTVAQANEACLASAQKKENAKKKNPDAGSCLASALLGHANANDLLVSPAMLASNQNSLWQLMSAQSVPALQ